MRKLVKWGLVVPMMLLMAAGLSVGFAAEETEGRSELNAELNRTLNGDTTRQVGARDANSVENTGDTATLNGAETESTRSAGRADSADRASREERLVRRGRQAPRGNMVTELQDKGWKWNYGGHGGGNDEGNDDDEGGNDDDEDQSPSHPAPQN